MNGRAARGGAAQQLQADASLACLLKGRSHARRSASRCVGLRRYRAPFRSQVVDLFNARFQVLTVGGEREVAATAYAHRKIRQRQHRTLLGPSPDPIADVRDPRWTTQRAVGTGALLPGTPRTATAEDSFPSLHKFGHLERKRCPVPSRYLLPRGSSREQRKTGSVCFVVWIGG